MITPRIHSLLFTFLFFTTFQISVYSQQKDALFTNSKPIEVEAYKDVDGSPYCFKEWQKGKVLDKEGKELSKEAYLLNYNGYTKSFEIRKGNNYIALNERFYSKVIIETEEDGKSKETIFRTDFIPNRSNRFMKLVYQGADFQFVQDYQVSLTAVEKQVYNANKASQAFSSRPLYYFVKDGKAKPIKLKKKDLLNLFSEHSAALKKFVKKHKLKLNKENQLVQFLSYYEELRSPTNQLAQNKN